MTFSHVGWEETVDASLTYLLKTSLAKSTKETITLPISLEPLQDIDMLKKKISLVVDRICKGIRLVPSTSTSRAQGGPKK